MTATEYEERQLTRFLCRIARNLTSRWGARKLVLPGMALLAATALVLAQAPPFLGIKILPNGNVGINTPTPQAPLHVIGNTIVTGTISGQSTGPYGNAAVLQGYASSGAAQAPFIILYNDNIPGQQPQIRLVNTATDVFKNFIINNPTDSERYLVHATLEGPEGAVYYRGSARLRDGRAEITLPHYFEALTRPEDRTVLLTNVDGFDQLSAVTQQGQRIRNGKFIVVSSNRHSSQAFDWEVKAVRADGARLQAEPLKKDIAVGGFGPYTFVAGQR